MDDFKQELKTIKKTFPNFLVLSEGGFPLRLRVSIEQPEHCTVDFGKFDLAVTIFESYATAPSFEGFDVSVRLPSVTGLTAVEANAPNGATVSVDELDYELAQVMDLELFRVQRKLGRVSRVLTWASKNADSLFFARRSALEPYEGVAFDGRTTRRYAVTGIVSRSLVVGAVPEKHGSSAGSDSSSDDEDSDASSSDEGDSDEQSCAGSGFGEFGYEEGEPSLSEPEAEADPNSVAVTAGPACIDVSSVQFSAMLRGLRAAATSPNTEPFLIGLARTLRSRSGRWAPAPSALVKAAAAAAVIPEAPTAATSRLAARRRARLAGAATGPFLGAFVLSLTPLGPDGTPATFDATAFPELAARRQPSCFKALLGKATGPSLPVLLVVYSRTIRLTAVTPAALTESGDGSDAKGVFAPLAVDAVNDGFGRFVRGILVPPTNNPPPCLVTPSPGVQACLGPFAPHLAALLPIEFGVQGKFDALLGLVEENLAALMQASVDKATLAAREARQAAARLQAGTEPESDAHGASDGDGGSLGTSGSSASGQPSYVHSMPPEVLTSRFSVAIATTPDPAAKPRTHNVSDCQLCSAGLRVVCSRCKHERLVRAAAVDTTAENAAEIGRQMGPCPKCTLIHSVSLVPAVLACMPTPALGAVVSAVAVEGCLVVNDLVVRDLRFVAACANLACPGTAHGPCLQYLACNKSSFCPGCGQMLSLTTPPLGFTMVGLDQSGTLVAAAAPSSGKPKVAAPAQSFKRGTPLPEHGACSHYKKSTRWLRFPCCGSAHPCDICHEKAALTPLCSGGVMAKTQICGHCSAEFAVSHKACPTCKGALVASAQRRTQHWEGGKGARDSTALKRGDKRKHAGASKTISRKAMAKNTGS
jgi:hypothetical protein